MALIIRLVEPEGERSVKVYERAPVLQLYRHLRDIGRDPKVGRFVYKNTTLSITKRLAEYNVESGDTIIYDPSPHNPYRLCPNMCLQTRAALRRFREPPTDKQPMYTLNIPLHRRDYNLLPHPSTDPLPPLI